MANALPPVPPLSTPTPQATNEFFVAMVIDGVVHQVYNVDGEEASRLLSNPTFVQVADGAARVGWTYDGAGFSIPQ